VETARFHTTRPVLFAVAEFLVYFGVWSRLKNHTIMTLVTLQCSVVWPEILTDRQIGLCESNCFTAAVYSMEYLTVLSNTRVLD